MVRPDYNAEVRAEGQATSMTSAELEPAKNEPKKPPMFEPRRAANKEELAIVKELLIDRYPIRGMYVTKRGTILYDRVNIPGKQIGMSVTEGAAFSLWAVGMESIASYVSTAAGADMQRQYYLFNFFLPKELSFFRKSMAGGGGFFEWDYVKDGSILPNLHFSAIHNCSQKWFEKDLDAPLPVISRDFSEPPRYEVTLHKPSTVVFMVGCTIKLDCAHTREQVLCLE